MTAHLSLRVPDALADALEEAAHESRTSKSEVAREHLTEALAGETTVPAHLRQELKRERLKRKNRMTWQRIHFPSNVADRFRRAFEQGDLDGDLNPGAIDDIRAIHVEDAEILFEDEPDRQEQAIEYVEALAEHARDATDASDFDRLNPEEMFEEYAGVEDGRARSDLQAVIEDARERLESGPKNEDALARALAKAHGVSEDLATEAVAQALEDRQ